jgi:hypothetical protein
MPNSSAPSIPDQPAPVVARTPPAPNDYLPPVQPPTAGFIMQLFFIPMIIVAIIVTVWLLFSWLAHMGSRPEELVKDLERLNDATWQKALTLAQMLRDPQNGSLRHNGELARRLASVLHAQLDAGQTDKDHIWFRMYLCRALGEFHVPDGLGALLRAADEERVADELDVRRAALQGIGILVDHVGPRTLQENDELLPVLTRAVQDRSDSPEQGDSRAKLRSTAAFVLGLLEGDEAGQLLMALGSDPYPLARYNAAIGLARRGDERAVPRLMDMLAADRRELGQLDQGETEIQWNRNHLVSNALRAGKQLAEKNPTADLAQLQTAIDALLKTDLPAALRLEALELSRILGNRSDPTDS